MVFHILYEMHLAQACVHGFMHPDMATHLGMPGTRSLRHPQSWLKQR